MAINATIPVGGNRLDPMLIQDPLMRAQLYADMRRRTPYRGPEYWTEYTVNPGERLMPELIAVRVWNDESLKWAVMVVAELDDPRREIEAATVLTLPSREWLRDRIKHYQSLDALAAPTGELIRIGKPKAVTLPEPPPPPTGSSGFEDELLEAMLALAQPLPKVLPSDRLTEETLNKQAKETERRHEKLRKLLEKWRDG